MGILKKRSRYNFLIFLCFIVLSNNGLARQEGIDNEFLTEEFFQKAKQFGNANQFDSSIFFYQKAANQVAHKPNGVLQDERYLYRAFDISHKSKTLLLWQAIKKTEGLTFAGIPDSLIDQEKDLNTNVAFHERELYLVKQKINSQLAVLSAFETGQKALSRGLGIISLSRAFAYACCHSVVTSFWKVDSKTAPRVLVYFL